MTDTITYPLKKELLVNGIKVEIIQLSQHSSIGAKIYSTQDARGDEVGLKIYKYLVDEGLITTSFLLTN